VLRVLSEPDRQEEKSEEAAGGSIA